MTKKGDDMSKKIKTVARCRFCGDSIYDFQDKVRVDKGSIYHKGCFELNKEVAISSPDKERGKYVGS